MTEPTIGYPNCKTEIKLTKSLAAPLIEAAHDKSRVSGLTHNFYRYPARFSPKFGGDLRVGFTFPIAAFEKLTRPYFSRSGEVTRGS